MRSALADSNTLANLLLDDDGDEVNNSLWIDGTQWMDYMYLEKSFEDIPTTTLLSDDEDDDVDDADDGDDAHKDDCHDDAHNDDHNHNKNDRSNNSNNSNKRIALIQIVNLFPIETQKRLDTLTNQLVQQYYERMQQPQQDEQGIDQQQSSNEGTASTEKEEVVEEKVKLEELSSIYPSRRQLEIASIKDMVDVKLFLEKHNGTNSAIRNLITSSAAGTPITPRTTSTSNVVGSLDPVITKSNSIHVSHAISSGFFVEGDQVIYHFTMFWFLLQ